MLKELKIEGYKLLKDVTIQPAPGFNVITGETGAGKSLVLGALKYLLGAKGGEEMFAKGEDTVRVSADFLLEEDSDIRKKLIQNGLLDTNESEIFIERARERDDRSRVFLGGRRANLPVIKELSDAMIDFLEQHQASRLTERSALDVLDSTGDLKHQAFCRKTQDTFSEWSNLRAELDKTEERIRQLAERRDLMEFQLKELKDADLVSGELDDLNRELQVLASAKDLRQDAYCAYLILSGDEDDSKGMQDMLGEVIELVEPLAEIDPEWNQKLDELKHTEEVIREISRELNAAAETIQDDPARLDEVEKRIAAIEKLKRKYVRNHDQLIELRDKLTIDVESIKTSDEDLSVLRKKVKIANEIYVNAAIELSESRKKLAKNVEKELRKHLKDLDLPNARVEFRFGGNSDKKESPRGFDQVDILLSTNPSEELKPLRDVASGGEATRISLALKSLWAEREGVPVLVLDEGDIGIGGDTAYQVGEKFKQLAGSHQLIVVSHLAQVAAFADKHYRVRKSETKKSAGITVEIVDGDERIQELARMIGGTRDPESAFKLAKNLLEGNISTERRVSTRI